ncbi:coniferyl aldehyde dehydrogenase [Photobacterium sp. ZSDE20]|uniref:Aldehyde dehydrogenase n=1 Tax=Photobacterium pectinilyticum TaxID=2906793 RepID=A0ABT1MXU9_9GAMM|nr:coniferyl aldehyde dehydrogenase [Photobacterium sp. ZSDE20]MCQ1056667.1 coniferyl aldehyde dehydrogenase [Photobacterium sp. ZSDE20]MDD1820946.1 coniferyl aldehyde dehydrogenase [Photobacterium sp. ZSDE20]
MTVAENTQIQPAYCTDMDRTLTAQQAAFREATMPSLDERKSQLTALKRAIKQHRETLCQALAKDYGQRHCQDSLVADIVPCINNINYTLKKLKGWMKPSKRHAGLMLFPAKVAVHYQPVGVVGIVVPWNFPVMLSLGPLISALAAGNRAMIKLSEFTPATNQVLRTLIEETFQSDHVAVFEGEADAAAHFTQLPFDHLLFTGSTAIGHHVMRAAADNLTPVTLELGGKSPVIVAQDMPIALAVERTLFGKCMNAGQICVAPDYILVPKGQAQAFIDSFIEQFNRHYPGGVNNPDFASVINDRQYQRLCQWLDEAKQLGANVFPCHEKARSDAHHRLVPHLLSHVPPQATVMQEEIFGPLLPVVEYNKLADAMDFIKQRSRPLALYLMSQDPAAQQQVRDGTISGGMAINETLLQVAADDAPFGGIGPSGMGHYHGKEGFLTFSKAKTVLKQHKFSTTGLIKPPYNRWWQKLMLAFFMR